MDKKKEDSRFELTELFMAMADMKRTYIGTMQREKLDESLTLVRGKVKVEGNLVTVMGNSAEEMWRAADVLVILNLDYDLHKTPGPKFEILMNDYLLN
jgi:hypothetical protein